jgi:TRAP-type C4-dicarboxylate transport system permease small subunit
MTGQLARAIIAADAGSRRVATVCAVAALAIAALSGLYQVWTRFVIHDSSAWTEVTTRTLLIWMVFLAIAPVLHSGAAISIDLVYRLSSGLFRRLLAALIFLATVAFLGVLVIWGTDIAWRARFQMLAGLDISIAWAYSAIPIGASLGLLSCIAIALERRPDVPNDAPVLEAL